MTKTKELKNKGITLIALIITIIVMLILVSVTISMAINGGLFDFAGKSVGDTQNSILAEQEMANGRLKIDGIWYDSIDDYISGKPSENQEGNEPPTDEGSGLPYTSGTRPYFPNTDFIQVEGTNLNNGLVIQDSDGNQYVWIEVPNDGTGPNYSSVSNSADYDNIEIALRRYASDYISPYHYDDWYDSNGKVAPGSLSLNSNSANSGSSTSSSTSTSSSNSGSSTSSSASTSSSNSGSSSSSSASVFTPKDVTPTGSPSFAGSMDQRTTLLTSLNTMTLKESTNLDDNSGCGLTYVQYTMLKHQMLTSVYENGGFWIGRFEAGFETPYNIFDGISNIRALSKSNLYPIESVTCFEAQLLSARVALDLGLENYTSSLMFGIQWDLALKHLQNKGTSYYDLAYDSTSLGNYYNTFWNVSNPNSKYADYYNYKISWKQGAYGQKSNCDKILLSTGAIVSALSSAMSSSASTSGSGLDVGINGSNKMNIFDLAGNLWEYTLELSFGSPYSSGGHKVTARGGSFICFGTGSPVLSRRIDTYHYVGNEEIGFRVSIF